MPKDRITQNNIAERYNIFGLEYFQRDEELDKKYYLNEVDLYEIAETVGQGPDANTKSMAPAHLYKRAGIKSILAVVMDLVGHGNLDSIFFEFTKLTASPGEFQQLNFNCYWCNDPKSAVLDKDLIDKNLRLIHGMLRDKKLSIFNHQGFFSLPKNPNAYASYHDQILPFKRLSKGEIANTRDKLTKTWEKEYKNLAKPLELEETDDDLWAGRLWVRNRPFTDLTYDAYLGSSYYTPIVIPESTGLKEPGESGVRFLHAILHGCFNYCFLPPEKQDENTLLLSIPLLAPIVNKEEKKAQKKGQKADREVNYVGQGAIFMYLKTKGGIPESKVMELIGTIANIGKDLTYNYLLEVGIKQSNILREHTMRAAFAGILSRNGSHNLGSHVLSSVPGGDQNIPDLHNLLNYIQERFDYLALVTTDFPVWTYPVHFVNDLARRFMKQRLLLTYLAETENIGPYEYQRRKIKDAGKMEFRYHDYTEEELNEQQGKLVFHLTYFNQSTGESYKILDSGNHHQQIAADVLIAVPGGTVGYHAVFMILENIIRNSAKYGFGTSAGPKPKNLEVHIELEEFGDEDFVEVRVWDNVSKDWRDERSLVDEMNKRLSAPFIDRQTGMVNNENLGLAEMRIAAGFLNIKSRSRIGGSNGAKSILYERNTTPFPERGENNLRGYRGFISAFRKEVEGEGFLGYKFPIPKPKDIRFEGSYPGRIKKLVSKAKNKNRIYFENETGKYKRFQDSDFVVIHEDGDYDKKDSVVRGVIEVSEHWHKGQTIKDRLDDHLALLPNKLLLVVGSQEFPKVRASIQRLGPKYEVEAIVQGEMEAAGGNLHLKGFHRLESTRGVGGELAQLLADFYDTGFPAFDALGRLLENLDDFPGRVILVSDRLTQLKKDNKLPDIFRKRVVTIGKEEFLEQLENDDDLYLYLYYRWIEHLKYVLFDKDRYHYPLELKIDTAYTDSGIGIELYKKVFEEFKEIIAYSITEQGFQRELRTKPLALKTFSSAQLDQIYNSLVNINFAQIKKEAQPDSWYEEYFVEKWTNLAIKDLAVDKTQEDEIIKLLCVYFLHYFVAYKKFFYKNQETVETLPRIFKANDDITGNAKVSLKRTEDNKDLLRLKQFNERINTNLYKKDELKYSMQCIFYQRHTLTKGKLLEGIDVLYNEALSGSQILFPLLKNMPNNVYEREKLYFQMVENGMLRMAIFDERLFKYCKNKEKVKERLEKGKIAIPYSLHYENQIFNMEDLEIEIANEHLGEKIGFTKGYLSKEERTSLSKQQVSYIDQIDVLIIHQGILDKLFIQYEAENRPPNAENPKDRLNQFIRTCKLQTPYVVITSGRGKPNGLPARTKFIPYSNLQTMLMQEYPEKLLFTQVLMKVATAEGPYLRNYV